MVWEVPSHPVANLRTATQTNSTICPHWYHWHNNNNDKHNEVNIVEAKVLDEKRAMTAKAPVGMTVSITFANCSRIFSYLVRANNTER